jgi:hypothetical protein
VESNRVTKAKSQTFAPVGRCIYCGTTAGSLTREHIVPIGLGGGLILPKASCTECSAVTKSFETTCQRKMFVRHRLAQGLVRHQSEIPDEVRNLPNFLIIPFIGGLPGMIAGKNPQIFFRVYGMAVEWAQLSDAAARAVALAQEFNMIAFTRMLAKIAHSFAVSQLTIEGFDAELLELIMGASPHLGPFLIGESTEQVPIPENILHQVGMTFMPWGQRWLVIVRIRLWASHGTPGYNVIAGQLIETPERLTRFDLRPLR